MSDHYFTVVPGTPIFDHQGERAIAHWAVKMHHSHPWHDFYTEDHILGERSNPSPCRVIFDNACGWRLGIGCSQRDLRTNPNFILNPFHGGFSKERAMRVLMEDEDFIDIFIGARSAEDIRRKARAYLSYVSGI